jgi:vacuolar-type H+-ATPase subunit E/Vma4
MAREEAQKLLSDAILAEAQKRADAAAAEAKAECERILSGARAAAAAETEQLLREGAERTRKSTQMILKAVEQDVARRKLRAREEVLRESFTAAAAELGRVQGEAYRESAARLAAEGLRAMPGDNFVLKASGLADSEGAAIATRVGAALRAEGRAVQLRFQADAALPRGVVIESADGRLRWDNTYPARLERMKDELRRKAAQVLFEEA